MFNNDQYMSPAEMRGFVQNLNTAVETFSCELYAETHREHLGASIIGDDCAKKIWLSFRWVRLYAFSGRMLRLFNRGHREEPQLIQLLRGVGWQIFDIDPRTGEQIRITDCEGHYGGSLDSVGIPPPAWNYAFPMLVEFKTHSAKSFAKLVKDGVQKSKPQHHSQMCSYGQRFKFDYALYCAVNKDDDTLYFEVVKLDPRWADDLTSKAKDIIQADHSPPPISQQPEFWVCKMCEFHGICWSNEPVAINCRSCKHAQAGAQKSWFCRHYNQTIPPDVIPKGCPNHRSILL